MPIRINGSTSGYIELAAPAVAGSTVLTLPTDSIQPGMVLVATNTFSAASSVSINNCFTSTYTDYRLNISWSASVESTVYSRLRVAGNDATGNDYKLQYLEMNNTSVGAGQVNTTGWWSSSAVTYNSTDMVIFGPNIAATTRMIYNHVESVSTGRTQFCGGAHVVSTAYDGITIYTGSGTITGTIRVYGYRNA